MLIRLLLDEQRFFADSEQMKYAISVRGMLYKVSHRSCSCSYEREHAASRASEDFLEREIVCRMFRIGTRRRTHHIGDVLLTLNR